MGAELSFVKEIFGKPIHELEAPQLEALRSVHEGWFVEYKRELPKAKSIAKSITAFANHHGGWIFYGIDEDRQSNTAGGFPGILLDKEASSLALVRDAIRQQASPTPIYEAAALRGPCPAIDLDSDKFILAIEVPAGPNPPYIHSSGRIYRRVADSSDPKEETDRAVLDILWERGRSKRKVLSDFLMKEPRMSKGDGNNFLHLSLLPNRLAEPEGRGHLDWDHFADTMADESVGGMAFENAFPTHDSLIARQVAGNQADRMVMTFRMYHSGAAKVTIPLNSYGCDTWSEVTQFSGYVHAKEFFDSISKHKLRSILDLNFVLGILTSVLVKYRLLAKELGLSGPFYSKALVTGAWRTTPYIDLSSYAAFIKKHGPPVVQDDVLMAPHGLTPESLLQLPRVDSSAPKARDQTMLEMIPLFLFCPGVTWDSQSDTCLCFVRDRKAY